MRVQQVVDAGDLAVNPFDIGAAIEVIEAGAESTLTQASRLLTLGGDHTFALPLLRCVARRHGPAAVLHFDAHLDTLGHVLRRTVHARHAVPPGVTGGPDRSCPVAAHRHPRSALRRHRPRGVDPARLRHRRVHRLRPAGPRRRPRGHARAARRGSRLRVRRHRRHRPRRGPGTGTPETGGLTSREALATLRGLAGLDIVSADIVEVAPAYDHAEVTGIAAAHVGLNC